MPRGVEALRGTLPRGGTIIGSSRTNPYKVDGGPDQVRETLKDLGIDALIAIGGEDTRSEEHTSEHQSLMRISYAAFCLNNKTIKIAHILYTTHHRKHTLHILRNK